MRPRGLRLSLALPLALGLLACRPESIKPPEPAAPPPAVSPPGPAQARSVAQNQPAVAKVRVVDLEGRPLAGMAPIATTTPNAYERPVTKGPLTGADGFSETPLDPNQYLYVRAWDPNLAYFANNFYDVPPGEGIIEDTLTIQMAPAAALAAEVVLPNGRPCANANMNAELIHPERGPWWPVQAQTGPTGRVLFRQVPPGRFMVRLETEAGAAVELPAVDLPPGGAVDLGRVELPMETQLTSEEASGAKPQPAI